MFCLCFFPQQCFEFYLGIISARENSAPQFDHTFLCLFCLLHFFFRINTFQNCKDLYSFCYTWAPKMHKIEFAFFFVEVQVASGHHRIHKGGSHDIFFLFFPPNFFIARWRVQSSDTRCGAGNYTRHQFPAEASSCTESRWFQLLQAPPVRRRRAADGVQGAQGGDQLPHGGPQQGVVWRQGRDHPAVHQIGLQLHDGQGQTGWPMRQSKPWSRFGHCICFWAFDIGLRTKI